MYCSSLNYSEPSGYTVLHQTQVNSTERPACFRCSNRKNIIVHILFALAPRLSTDTLFEGGFLIKQWFLMYQVRC